MDASYKIDTAYTDIAIRMAYICDRKVKGCCESSDCGTICIHTTDMDHAAYRVHDEWNAYGDPRHGIITLMEKERSINEPAS